MKDDSDCCDASHDECLKVIDDNDDNDDESDDDGSGSHDDFFDSDNR